MEENLTPFRLGIQIFDDLELLSYASGVSILWQLEENIFSGAKPFSQAAHANGNTPSDGVHFEAPFKHT